ncbi:hypothetical protein [Rufibacter roseolus]|uniref:hypothetical protein n=1 Tax=Rufibacter roseolus TaxID=2817375 RepID=UPI001B316A5E|nr:hypothetical protein [Rufibacter roseolus]
MKNLILPFLSLLFCCGCTSAEENTSETANPLIAEEQKPEQNQRTSAPIDKSKLLGIWWDSNDKDAPHAVFQIDDSTVVYPEPDDEGQTSFKYQLKGDSLIFEFGEEPLSSKIDKATGDTLELTTSSSKLVLIKAEN